MNASRVASTAAEGAPVVADGGDATLDAGGAAGCSLWVVSAAPPLPLSSAFFPSPATVPAARAAAEWSPGAVPQPSGSTWSGGFDENRAMSCHGSACGEPRVSNETPTGRFQRTGIPGPPLSSSLADAGGGSAVDDDVGDGEADAGGVPGSALAETGAAVFPEPSPPQARAGDARAAFRGRAPSARADTTAAGARQSRAPAAARPQRAAADRA
jgi:hypothetical protein